MSWFLNHPFVPSALYDPHFPSSSVSTETSIITASRFAAHGVRRIQLASDERTLTELSDLLYDGLDAGWVPSLRPNALDTIQRLHDIQSTSCPVDGENGLSHLLSSSLFMAVNCCLIEMNIRHHWYPTNKNFTDPVGGRNARKTDHRLNIPFDAPIFELKVPDGTKTETINDIWVLANKGGHLLADQSAVVLLDPDVPNTPQTGKVYHLLIIGALLSHRSRHAILSNYDVYLLFHYDEFAQVLRVSRPIARAGAYWSTAIGRRPAMLDSLQRPILTLKPFPLVLAVTLDCVRKYEQHQADTVPGAGGVGVQQVNPPRLDPPVWPSSASQRPPRPQGTFPPPPQPQHPGQGTSRWDLRKERGEQERHGEDLRPRTPSATFSLATATDGSSPRTGSDECTAVMPIPTTLDKSRSRAAAADAGFRSTNDIGPSFPLVSQEHGQSSHSSFVLSLPHLLSGKGEKGDVVFHHVSSFHHLESVPWPPSAGLPKSTLCSSPPSRVTLGRLVARGSVWTTYELAIAPSPPPCSFSSSHRFDTRRLVIKLLMLGEDHDRDEGSTRVRALDAAINESKMLSTVLQNPDLDFVCRPTGSYVGWGTTGTESDRVRGLAMIMENAGTACSTDLDLLSVEEKPVIFHPSVLRERGVLTNRNEIISHYTLLSAHGILHGDAHPRNWLRAHQPLSARYRILIIDWGLASVVLDARRRPGGAGAGAGAGAGDKAGPGIAETQTDRLGQMLLDSQVDEIKRAFRLNDIYQLSAPQFV